MNMAGWTGGKTFQKYYNKPLRKDNVFRQRFCLNEIEELVYKAYKGSDSRNIDRRYLSSISLCS